MLACSAVRRSIVSSSVIGRRSTTRSKRSRSAVTTHSGRSGHSRGIPWWSQSESVMENIPLGKSEEKRSLSVVPRGRLVTWCARSYAVPTTRRMRRKVFSSWGMSSRRRRGSGLVNSGGCM